MRDLSVRIPLSASSGAPRAYAVIEDRDAYLAAFNWQLSSDGYAMRSITVSGKRRSVVMHREILGLEWGDPLTGDHVNGDRLNNRRSNLRVITKAQQAQNMAGHQGSLSRFRGVTWNKRIKKWQAQVHANGRLNHLGYFTEEEDAGRAASLFRDSVFTYNNEAREGHRVAA